MQKIVPCLWFENNCEEAINFYTSIFPNSKIISTKRYEEGMQTPGIEEMVGKILTVIFELDGYRFMALDGGPIFKINPSISFSVNRKTEKELDELWEKLSEGGKILMEYQKYDFSEKYGWVNDKYGVSWQLSLGEETKIIPSFLFVGPVVGKAGEAIDFYTSIFKNSNVVMKMPYEKDDGDQEGYLKFSLFTLEGQKFVAMDSSLSHDFGFNEAVSLCVECKDQEEVNELWNRLTTKPEFEQCGWLKDKYGVSWQIIPKRLGELLDDQDREKANRALTAMLHMKKIDVSELEKAFNGK